MTGTVTTRVDADRVASMVADGLTLLLDGEYWKFHGDDLLGTARTVERLARLTYAVLVAVAGEVDLARLAQTHDDLPEWNHDRGLLDWLTNL